MKKNLFSIIFLFLVTLLFFFPIFKGYIPFPGDLLVSSTPYNTYSYLGYAPGGVPNKAQGPDVMHELYPWKYFVIESLKQGQIPFWTPYNFSGNTLMANFQSGTFYPFNGIFFLFPFNTAWTIFIALAPFLAATFMYLFLCSIRVSRPASLFAGIVFAFSSYMVVWMEYGNITHTFMWLPLALYFTEKYLQKRSWKSLLFLTITLWFSFLAGYIQGFFYLLVIVLVYFFGKNGKGRVSFLLALLFPVLLSLFQFLPTLELFTQSTRGGYTLEQIVHLLNPWWYGITALIPDFFGNPATRNYWFDGTYIERVSFFGVLPLLFSLVALFSKKTKESNIFSFLFIVSFLFSLDLFVTRYLYQLPIPIFSTTVPTRILSIFVFSGAVLSAFGFDSLLAKKNKKTFLYLSVVSMIVFVISLIFTFILTKQSNYVETIVITRKNLLLPFFSCLIFVGLFIFRWMRFISRKNSIIICVVILVTLGDLFYFFHKLTPFSPPAFIFPKTAVISYLQDHAGINRYWGYGSGYIASNFQTVDKTFTSEGFDALHLRWYTELIAASKDGKVPQEVSRDNANIASGYGPEDLEKNFVRQKALNLFGIKYLLFKNETLGIKWQPDGTFPKKKYKLVWQQSPWQIYENLEVSPRFFLTNTYRVIPDTDKAIETIYHTPFDGEKELILAIDPKISRKPLHERIVRLIRYEPNSVSFTTSSDADALLFLSDTYSPNWHAKVDGKEQLVLRADHAFRAVAVPKGEHQIEFYYYDKAFEMGLFLSGIALIGFVVFLVVIKSRKF
jgi:hypothetical protein